MDHLSDNRGNLCRIKRQRRCYNTAALVNMQKELASDIFTYYPDSACWSISEVIKMPRFQGGGMMKNPEDFRICAVPLLITKAEIVISPKADIAGLKNENIGLAIRIALQLQPLVEVLYRNTKYGQGYLSNYLPEWLFEEIFKRWERLNGYHALIEANNLFRDYLRSARRYKEQKEDKYKPRFAPGYVYLIQSSTGYYKIGRTVNPDNRMATFTVKLPFEVEYTCVIQCEDMYGLEKELHARFASKRVNGEWFNLAPEDVEYIKGLVK
jgi:hypothetical protein